MLISIITINYNDKIGLERTIKSVREQIFTNFEHIIIDGGSNDGSKEVIEANKNSFRYWVSEPDNGIYNAMNKGIKAAKGDYLYFLNSGDLLNDSNALKRIHVHLKHHDMVYFNINVRGEVNHVQECPSEMSFEYLYNDLPPHQSTFIRKTLFEKYGYYDESLKIVSDWKFLILALLKYNATYKHVDDVFSTYYEGGISSREGSFEAMEKERKLVLSSEFPILMNDLKENFKLKRVIRNLRKSKKINLLVRLGLIEKF